MNKLTTICATATAPGTGAIAIIRISGPEAIQIFNKVFWLKKVTKTKSRQMYIGSIEENGLMLDEAMGCYFTGPNSYTGEDMAEIYCHGSPYIRNRIIQLLINNGARPAEPGEFTQRAFLNGKIDLIQAESVAALIAASSEQSHRIAIQQLKGGTSEKIRNLRKQLIEFSALIELELDFSQEDVEFADRQQLKILASNINNEIGKLLDSFTSGNSIVNGIPVVIAGKPNAGKSTLLNTLLQDERALVSETPGTTRDSIEETITVGGCLFRFIDTAGLRHSADSLEKMGIERTLQSIAKASVVLLVTDAEDCLAETAKAVRDMKERMTDSQTLIVLVNKTDKYTDDQIKTKFGEVLIDSLHNKDSLLFISAKTGTNIDCLLNKLQEQIEINNYDTIITSARHYDCLHHAAASTERILQGLENNTATDLIAQDIREAGYHLGSITGEITNEEVLGEIFSKFCIGK